MIRKGYVWCAVEGPTKAAAPRAHKDACRTTAQFPQDTIAENGFFHPSPRNQGLTTNSKQNAKVMLTELRDGVRGSLSGRTAPLQPKKIRG